jgi:hypothetical protein
MLGWDSEASSCSLRFNLGAMLFERSKMILVKLSSELLCDKHQRLKHASERIQIIDV